MKDMYDILGLTVGRSDGSYGVEIEVEGKFLPNHADKWWRIEKDGSLRGEESNEYVFKKPLSMADTEKALKYLEKLYVDNDSRVDESVRAGVHTHLNIQNYKPIELITLATVYYILEDHFVHWSGNSRVGNHFCLRAVDAEDIIYKLVDVCTQRDWRMVNTDKIRYASLNWNSMFKYGSIEFRSMRSTRDMNAILTWVKLIEQLAKGAKKFNNPKEVLAAVSEMNAGDRFIQFVMEDLANEFIPLKLDIWKTTRNVQPLGFMVDWEEFCKERVNPFPNPKHKKAERFEWEEPALPPIHGIVIDDEDDDNDFDWDIPEQDDEDD